MKRVLFLIVVITFSAINIFNQTIPKLISYQGVLTDIHGIVVPDGNYSLTFKLYNDAMAGTQLWTEGQSISVTNGIFNVILGSVTALNLPFNAPYWLGIRVGTDAELSPRIQLTSVGYAFRTLKADTASVAISAPSGGGWTDDGTMVRLTTITDNVGIGTANPSSNLHIYENANKLVGIFIENPNTGSSSAEGIYFSNENGDVAGIRLFDEGNASYPNEMHFFNNRPNGSIELSTSGGEIEIANNGNVGIGTTNPGVNLHVMGGTDVEAATAGSGYFYIGSSTGTHLAFDNNEIMVKASGTTSGTLYFQNDGGISQFGGRVICSELQLTGGSDIAEPFEIKEPNKIEPGMVVVIDTENPGKLKVSTKAYDRCVAGIVSGAGDIKPGVRMMSDQSFENNHNVALTGRVYALCDASFGSIEPGDLITTSLTSGYAMKVTDYQRAQGAILGKALTRLDKGQGLVLVLVSLQ